MFNVFGGFFEFIYFVTNQFSEYDFFSFDYFFIT